MNDEIGESARPQLCLLDGFVAWILVLLSTCLNRCVAVPKCGSVKQRGPLLSLEITFHLEQLTEKSIPSTLQEV